MEGLTQTSLCPGPNKRSTHTSLCAGPNGRSSHTPSMLVPMEGLHKHHSVLVPTADLHIHLCWTQRQALTSWSIICTGLIAPRLSYSNAGNQSCPGHQAWLGYMSTRFLVSRYHYEHFARESAKTNVDNRISTSVHVLCAHTCIILFYWMFCYL